MTGPHKWIRRAVIAYLIACAVAVIAGLIGLAPGWVSVLMVCGPFALLVVAALVLGIMAARTPMD